MIEAVEAGDLKLVEVVCIQDKVLISFAGTH
jgi:hypothetical protein